MIKFRFLGPRTSRPSHPIRPPTSLSAADYDLVREAVEEAGRDGLTPSTLIVSHHVLRYFFLKKKT